ncbi:SseB family protein [Actinoplanes sp. NPDC049265]|uniref:SseB family protein n=1 Tax=Actinoplanes sp. NPDC049265 TaxID=3363902 RepID=UPI0037103F47
MSEWEPATDAEKAMRDALRTDDQESYFRILAGVDLLLPVSADALAGLAPLGWGTWSTGGRTHVLAFTSPSALQACLADYTGSARRVAYAELAETWPNLEWWLAVNPGLPIEGYLPAWFVAQLSRGDVRLPKRGPGRETQDLAGAALGGKSGSSQQGGPMPPAGGAGPSGALADAGFRPGGGAFPPGAELQKRTPGAAAAFGNRPPSSAGGGMAPATGGAASRSGSPEALGGSPSGGSGSGALGGSGFGGSAGGGSGPGAPGGSGFGGSSGGGSGLGAPGVGGSGFGGSLSEGSGGASAPSSGITGTRMGGAPSGPAPTSAPPNFPPAPASAPPAASPSGAQLPTRSGERNPSGQPGQVGPGGLPIRTPGAVLPSGLPSRVPQSSQVPTGTAGSGFVPGGYGRGGSTAAESGPEVPAAYSTPNVPGTAPSSAPPGSPTSGPGGLGAPTSGAGALGTTSGPGSLGTPISGPGGFGVPTSGAGALGTPTSGAGGLGGPGAPGVSTGGPSTQPSSLSNGPAGNRSPLGSDQAPGALPRRTAPPSGTPASGIPAGSAPASGAPTGATASSGAPMGAGQSSGGPAGSTPSGAPISGPPVSGAPMSGAPMSGAPMSGAPMSGAPMSGAPMSGAPAGAGSRGASSSPAPTGGALPPLQDLRGPLPTRTPMAHTPPVPGHITTPEAPTGLPRRQPGETPPSMAAAAQALTGNRTTTPPPTETPRPNIMPPVVPGTPGADAGHPARNPFASSATTRPEPQAATRPEAHAATRPESQATISPEAQAGARPGTARPEFQAGTRPDTTRPEFQPTTGPASQSAPRPDLAVTTRFESPAVTRPGSVAPEGGPAAQGQDSDFSPANAVERDLLAAADEHSTDSFLSTLLLATVLVPVADNSRPGSTPGESGFVFRTEEMDGGTFLVVFTSRDRIAEHHDHPVRTAPTKFLELIRNWPDPNWSFAVNPGSPVGAKYPGSQIIALASWADEAGLGVEPEERAEKAAPVPQRASDAAQHATVMQKTVPPSQVDFFMDRGYDRVAGFVHRANEVEHLRTPGELFAALGLVYEGSPFAPDAKEAFVLRWPAYRPSLYRIPYGGQSEQALRAMDGWVIERPPFRGNGFAPGEGRDVVAEFKVDSVRLPHGAQLWRMDADGTEKMVAIFDADAPQWRKVGEQ